MVILVCILKGSLPNYIWIVKHNQCFDPSLGKKYRAHRKQNNMKAYIYFEIKSTNIVCLYYHYQFFIYICVCHILHTNKIPPISVPSYAH